MPEYICTMLSSGSRDGSQMSWDKDGYRKQSMVTIMAANAAEAKEDAAALLGVPASMIVVTPIQAVQWP